MADPLFHEGHYPALTALNECCKESAVNDTISQLRLAGVDWSKIISVVLAVVPAIEAKDWAAVIAALLTLLPQSA